MFKDKKRWFKWIAAALILGAAAIFVWQRYFVKTDEGLASGNGRIEATEIDVAAKIPARIREILVHEGDFVTAGQLVVLMDTDSLNAPRREAEAQLQRAQDTAATARSQVVQRQAEKEAAQAIVNQRLAEQGVAKKRWARFSRLVLEGAMTQIDADAEVAAADAAIATARADVAAAELNIIAQRATIQRIQVDINDSILKAPRDGRVQFRVSEPGEVMGQGGMSRRTVAQLDGQQCGDPRGIRGPSGESG